MNRQWSLSVGLLTIISVLFLGYQNCSKSFLATQSTVGPTAGELENPSELDPLPEYDPPEKAPPIGLSLCENGDCVQSDQQKIFFTNLIGIPLKVQMISKTSDREMKIEVVNNFNPNMARKARLTLSLKSNGFVFPVLEDSSKPWLCLDPSQAPEAIISGEMNCSSPLVITGTHQKVIRLGNTFQPLAVSDTIAGQALNSGTCAPEHCLELANGQRVIFSDLADSGFGVRISSRAVLDDGRVKLSLVDPIGRTITFLVQNISTGNLSPDQFQLFDQRDHGYLCLQPRSKGLMLVPSARGLVMNCFSSVRYSILSPNGTFAGSGSLPFKDPQGLAANTSIWAVNEDKFFEGIIPESF